MANRPAVHTESTFRGLQAQFLCKFHELLVVVSPASPRRSFLDATGSSQSVDGFVKKDVECESPVKEELLVSDPQFIRPVA